MSSSPFHKLYSIPSNALFLKGVATLITSHPDFALEDWSVYVPTRRAAFDLAMILRDMAPHNVTLLPRIYSLGDVDPEELALKGALDQPISPPLRHMQRQILMGELLSKFRYGGKPLDPRQCLNLGDQLLELVDTLRLQGLSVEVLAQLDVVSSGADHWETIKTFLSLLGQHWDAIVQDAGGLDPLLWQQKMMQAHESILPQKTPVMVAGSMGTVAATVSFMKRVHSLPHGVLVLPGLVFGKDYAQLSPKDPQYALYRLLHALGVRSGDVCPFGSPSASMDYSHMMEEPPELCAPDLPLGLCYMTAPDLRAEGEMIALGVREAFAKGAHRVLCVAAHDDLRGHIVRALRPWGYAGRAPEENQLMAHEMGRFLHGLCLWFSEDTVLDGLRATFTHAYAQAHQQTWQLFEENVLRATEGVFCWQRLLTVLENVARKEPTLKSLQVFVEDVARLTTFKKTKMNMAEICVHLQKIVQWLTGTEDDMSFWFQKVCGPETSAFETLWADLQRHSDHTLIDRHEIAPFIQSFLRHPMRPPVVMDDELMVLSPAEARFVEADVVFLGGLNAGIWPAERPLNPFLTRKMERDLGLLPQDYFHGQSAHDFIQHLRHKKVVLSYAQKGHGGPLLPSELLSYLKSFLQKGGRSLPQDKEIMTLWQGLRRVSKQDVGKPPTPKAKAAEKPKRFSVSDVISLQTNPYAFYAKHILNLRPLGQLPGEDPHRRFGIFMHYCLEVALKSPKTSEDAILWAFNRTFGDPEDFPFLWGKVHMMVDWVLAHTDLTQDRLLEVWGTFTFILNGDMLTLFAKADRIDFHGGSAQLIDYKTGQVPSQARIKLGLDPQLPLEALILAKGQFDHLPPRLAFSGMAHWKLPSVVGDGMIAPITADLGSLIEDTEAGLLSLLSYFQSEAAIYRAHPHGVQRESDYDHLARVDEWYGGGL